MNQRGGTPGETESKNHEWQKLKYWGVWSLELTEIGLINRMKHSWEAEGTQGTERWDQDDGKADRNSQIQKTSCDENGAEMEITTKSKYTNILKNLKSRNATEYRMLRVRKLK